MKDIVPRIKSVQHLSCVYPTLYGRNVKCNFHNGMPERRSLNEYLEIDQKY